MEKRADKFKKIKQSLLSSAVKFKMSLKYE